MKNNSATYIKMAAIGFVVIVALIIAYFIWHSSSISGKYPVSIVVAPQDATVMIGGVNIKGDKTYLAPGIYEYTVSRENFQEEKGTIIINDSRSTYSIIAPLNPANEQGEEILTEKITEFTKLEGFASTEAADEGEAFRKKNRITADLPYKNLLFTIGYRADTTVEDENAIVVTIHASPSYYDAAITQISNLGYNPAEYKIEIIGEENPFK